MSPQTKNIVIVISSILLAVFWFFPLFTTNATRVHWINKLMPTEEAAYAKGYIDHIRTRDFISVEKQTDPKMLNEESRKVFGQMADLFTNDTPKNIKPIGIDTVYTNGTKQISLTFEYELPRKWLTVNVVLLKQNNSLLVQGVHIKPLPDSLENLTRFTFTGKSPTHYIVFAVAIVLLIFNIYVLALCIKTPIPKRKWLWIVFVLAGFCKISFNWATGEFFFYPLILRMPLAQFSQDFYQPLFITMAIPIGAMVFLYKRRKWLAPSWPYTVGKSLVT